MSVKIAKKLQRNGLSDDKKRSTEDKNFSKKDIEKDPGKRWEGEKNRLRRKKGYSQKISQ